MSNITKICHSFIQHLLQNLLRLYWPPYPLFYKHGFRGHFSSIHNNCSLHSPCEIVRIKAIELKNSASLFIEQKNLAALRGRAGKGSRLTIQWLWVQILSTAVKFPLKPIAFRCWRFKISLFEFISLTKLKLW